MLRVSIRATETITDDEFDQMWTLYERSHDTDRDTFVRKTRKKFDELYLVKSRKTAEILGFMGARYEVVQMESGESIQCVYMGQAMFDRSLRGKGWALVAPVWFCARGVRRADGKRVVGWQDALTIRTFMLVAKNSPEYYPHPELAMPEDLREIRDILGRRHYGDAYCSETGVVKKERRLVLEENIDPKRLSNPHIRFFAETNPGYVDGNGLMQLGFVDRSFVGRMALKGIRSRIRGRRV